MPVDSPTMPTDNPTMPVDIPRMLVDSPITLVDSHCHLDLLGDCADQDKAVADALAGGVERLVTVNTDPRNVAEIAAIAQRHDSVFYSVGLHPHRAGDYRVTLDELVTEAENTKMVAIGESGLDYYYDNAAPDDQKANFATHIEAARITELPLIIHNRDADKDMNDILTTELAKGHFHAVAHCFSASEWLAHRLIKMGFYISFSGILTFKNSQELRRIAKTIPRDKLLVETDSPYLSPVPVRGQKNNSPVNVRYVAQCLAEVLDISAQEVHELTGANFQRLFSKVS